jgi:HAD superfamily hydrolase (TIGR01509 family)
MSKITTILFDFDGVIVDTEPQYDIFFNQLAEEYHLEINNFASLIKGVPLPEIMDKYFKNYSKKEKNRILEETREFELQMDFEFIPGVKAFIDYLEVENYKMAIVTSSPAIKMEIALRKLYLNDIFRVVISADKISRGKPDPMCYLLAAKELQSPPVQCLVFEDSIPGITAGKNANMKVIGVSTTIPADTLNKHVDVVIPDFTDSAQLISFL